MTILVDDFGVIIIVVVAKQNFDEERSAMVANACDEEDEMRSLRALGRVGIGAVSSSSSSSARGGGGRRRRPDVVSCRASSSSSGNDVTVIPGDYRVGATLVSISVFLGPICHLWFPQFFVHLLLGGFLSFQASRVRFRFSETDLDVVFIQPGDTDERAAIDAKTETSGDNKLQGGGANKWSFESVQNWEFWFPGFRCLCIIRRIKRKRKGSRIFFQSSWTGRSCTRRC